MLTSQPGLSTPTLPLRRDGPLPSMCPPECWDCSLALGRPYAKYRELRHQRMSAKEALDHPSVGLAVDPEDGGTHRPCCRDKILTNHDLSLVHSWYRDIATWAEGGASSALPHLPPLVVGARAVSTLNGVAPAAANGCHGCKRNVERIAFAECKHALYCRPCFDNLFSRTAPPSCPTCGVRVLPPPLLSTTTTSTIEMPSPLPTRFVSSAAIIPSSFLSAPMTT